MNAAEAIAQDERRAARDAWRRAGGSTRRALRTFTTEAERAEKRAELRAEREAARAYVATPEGMAAWQESARLNPHLSADNAAIVAHRLPGQIVGTARYWHRTGARVRKGETAAAFIGGGPALKFGPVAVFVAAQTSASDALAQFEDTGPTVSDPIPF